MGRGVLLVLVLSASCGEPGVPVNVSGTAFGFGGGGRIEGATVGVVEFPDLSTLTDEQGEWGFAGQLRSGDEVTFTLEGEGRPPIQTATFVLGEEGLEQVSFQSPDDFMYELLSDMVSLEPDPERCQIASTVTRQGYTLFAWSGETHGEPEATVSIEPALPFTSGPIYFDLASAGVIWPDPDLTRTTDDGGVLFLDVPEGEYRLEAHKAGATFREVKIKCRAGWVANAAPPWGLQALEGGVGPRLE
ncbi:MAG: hypothetical protein P1V51_07385 [Deltaproteobacteria bacterium]|nr:hypothetical protein [Deltaproteobacteria bacterium]